MTEIKWEAWMTQAPQYTPEQVAAERARCAARAGTPRVQAMFRRCEARMGLRRLVASGKMTAGV